MNFINEFKKVRVPGGKKYHKYFVNKDGDVISFKRDNPMLLSPKISDSGYYEISLRDTDGKRKFYFVHRIVASTYIKNPKRRNYINHIDGDKLNNRVENLEWVTVGENTQHAYDMGLILSSSKQCELYYEDTYIDYFNSKSNMYRYISNQTGYSFGHCRKCVEGLKYNPELNKYNYFIIKNKNHKYKPRGAIL